MHMGSVGHVFKKFALKKIPRKDGYVQASTGGKIPILIDSYYAVKGETYTDRALYVLSLDLLIHPEPEKDPYLKWQGLLFVERYPANAGISHEGLDQIMNNENGMYIPPRSP